MLDLILKPRCSGMDVGKLKAPKFNLSSEGWCLHQFCDFLQSEVGAHSVPAMQLEPIGPIIRHSFLKKKVSVISAKRRLCLLLHCARPRKVAFMHANGQLAATPIASSF